MGTWAPRSRRTACRSSWDGWATNNAKLEPAPNNCFKYGKIEPHGRKTDPFMAMVHAFVAADWIPEDGGGADVVFAPAVTW